MQWADWIDLDTIKALSRHASGSIGAILVFKAMGVLVDWGFTGRLKMVLKTIDDFVLVGLLIWLAYQMMILLWKGRIRIRNGSGLNVLVV